MDKSKRQAWLTCVSSDAGIPGALVLTESLRRTRTNRRIGVITCGDLSKEARLKLLKGFDDFFVIDDTLVPLWKGNWKQEGKGNQIRAILFALTLEMFERCIFLDVNSLALENIDEWFDCDAMMPPDLDNPFIFRPSIPLCEYLVEILWNVNGDDAPNLKMLPTYLKEWAESNHMEWKLRALETDEVANGYLSAVKFSIKNSRLISTCGHKLYTPNLVQFTDFCTAPNDLALQMMILVLTDGLAMTEKAVTDVWLQIFEESVGENLVDNHLALQWHTDAKCHAYDNEPIAIVGMSCRFPEPNSVDEFWNLLDYVNRIFR